MVLIALLWGICKMHSFYPYYTFCFQIHKQHLNNLGRAKCCLSVTPKAGVQSPITLDLGV